MNTLIRIRVISEAGTIETLKAISKAFSQFDRVVRLYTRFNDTSQLAMLNAQSGKTVEVSSELFNLVEKMLEISRLTEGAYDPTIIDLLEFYGFGKTSDYSRLDNPELMKELNALIKARPSFKEIELNRNRHSIKLVKGQRLDLGSIGKGFAIDLAAKTLAKFPSFIINAGGDIRAKGRNIENKYWRLGLMKTPLPNKQIQSDTFIGYTTVKNASLAGSGGWARKVKFFHHLIQPSSGLPMNEISQTYVSHKNATDADAWSTALFVSGSGALKILESLPGFEALLVNHDGTIEKTSGFSYQDI